MPYLPHQGLTPTNQQNGTVTLILTGLGEQRTFECPVNPSDITIDRPSRQMVTQTLTGAYQDHLGSGLMHVQVRGHTGWRRLRQQFADGFDAYKALRGLLYEYDQRVAGGNPQDVTLRLLMDVPSGWEHFRVSKEEARFSRSRSQPLLFAYDLSFVVLQDELAGKPVDPSPPFIITFVASPPSPVQVPPTTVIDKPKKVIVDDVDVPDPDPDPQPQPVPATNTFTYTDANWSTIKTVADLAAAWYGPLGFDHPASMWGLIAKANASILGPGATADTVLPQYVGGNTNPDRPLRVAPVFVMPVLNVATWNSLIVAEETSAINQPLDPAHATALVASLEYTKRTRGRDPFAGLDQQISGVIGGIANFISGVWAGPKKRSRPNANDAFGGY